MAQYLSNFKCLVMSPNNILFEGEAGSVFLTGDQGEFEVLSYHYPLLAVLVKGDIVINADKRIPIESGVVRFYANECIILVEEVKEPELAKT